MFLKIIKGNENNEQKGSFLRKYMSRIGIVTPFLKHFSRHSILPLFVEDSLNVRLKEGHE